MLRQTKKLDMKLNMFEGARRISILIGAVWIIGFVGYAIFTEPYVSMNFKIFSLGSPPLPLDGCETDDATEYFSTKTSSGKSISINLCFVASKADNGEMLIPYALNGKERVWMGRSYSTEVSNYKHRVANSFQMSAADEKIAEIKISKKRQEQWQESAMFVFGGLFVGWVLVTTIGWIVRGFLRIPHLNDTRDSD